MKTIAIRLGSAQVADENPRYEYSLALTSQFPFCGIPLRLDPYSNCQFACRYCFASARGGATGERRIRVADSESFTRRLERVALGFENSAVDEMLGRRIPIHMGGMSDPFPPIERRLKSTYRHLSACRDFGFPAVISTKSSLPIEEPWLSLLSAGRFAVQISISTLDDRLGREIDAGAPPPSTRLRVIRELSAAKVPVACRIQPVLPGHEEEVPNLIDAVVHAGVRHISVEHLKVPVERRWPHRDALNHALGMDLVARYRHLGAHRVGREWILPVEVRLPRVLQYRDRTRLNGASFGAADNDLLHFSDGHVCCSGVDLLGLGSGLTYNYLHAVRARDASGTISMSSLRDQWRPRRTIQRHLNSRSRQVGGTIEKYISTNWNGRPNGNSPSAFYGVAKLAEHDEDGNGIYRIDPEVMRLIG